MRATIAIACLFAAGLFLAVVWRVLDAWMSAHPSPSPIPLPLDTGVDRGLILAGYVAPSLDRVRFGKGVAVHTFMPQWSLEDATVVGSTVYVVWEKPGYGPHGYHKPSLGSLDDGHLRVIALPRVYDSLSFVDGGKILQGIRVGGGGDWYSLDGERARSIPQPHYSGPTFPHAVLSDGNRCVAGSRESGVAIYEVDPNDHRMPILSIDALKTATKGAMDAAAPLWCTHFHGEDFAFVGGSIGLIFRLDRGRASIVTTGYFKAIGERDLLIQDLNFELLQAHVTSD